MLRLCLLFGFFSVLCGCPVIAQSATTARSDGELLAVVVVMRHGVRAPIESETRSSAYNAQPWPKWPTDPGVLTLHGAEALRLLAEFYRGRYLSLLHADSCEHVGLYIEANTTQRTIASAKALSSGLSPKCAVEVHSVAGHFNPLFSPSMSDAVDHQRVKDATLGRIGDRPEWFSNAFARPLEEMHRVLTDCEASDCKGSVADFRGVMVRNGVVTPRDPRIEGSVTLGADFAENFLLQYTEGMPMSQVGWGRVSRADLNDLMQMNTQYHDFMLRTPYEAQVAASDLAAHLRDTIVRAATGRPMPLQIGSSSDRFILLDGHDSNLTWLGGLLRVDWVLPDQTLNATPPGSALVFEVRRSGDGGATVKLFFISQTLDQMRELRSLTGAEQPSIAPIFVPGCKDYACTVQEFSRVIDSAVDMRFVSSSSN